MPASHSATQTTAAPPAAGRAVQRRRLVLRVSALALLGLSLAVLLDAGARTHAEQYSITANWLAALLSLPLPALAALLLFDRWQREEEGRHRRQVELENRVHTLIPRLVLTRSALEEEPGLTGVADPAASLALDLQRLEESIAASPDGHVEATSADIPRDSLAWMERVQGHHATVLELLRDLESALLQAGTLAQDAATLEALEQTSRSVLQLRAAIVECNRQGVGILRSFLQHPEGRWNGRWVTVDGGGYALYLRGMTSFAAGLPRVRAETAECVARVQHLEDSMHRSLSPADRGSFSWRRGAGARPRWLRRPHPSEVASST